MPFDDTEVLLPIVMRETHTQYVDRNVTINRAPTDESVRLLREMEQQAEAEIIKSIRVGDTTFECVLQQSFDSASDTPIWRAVFKLNGKAMRASVEIPGRILSGGDDLHKAWGLIRDEMAKVIATEVLHDAFIKAAQRRCA